MRKGLIIACICTLAFVSAAGFTQVPSVAPLTSEALAAILGPSAAGDSCPKPQNEVLFAAKKPRPGAYKSCSATADCTPGTTVSCNYTGAGGNCIAVDRDCSVNERGHVTCQGVTTNCPTNCNSECGGIWCCQCAGTGDCFSCCRCDGGGAGFCAMQCG